MGRIAIIVGHSKLKNGSFTGANGVVNEYKYNKALAPKVKKQIEKLTNHKCDVIICPEKKFKSAAEEYNYKMQELAKKNYILVIELHLNSFSSSKANGTEVLYYPQSEKGEATAKAIQKQLAKHYKDRGIKDRRDLYILRDTKPVAVIVESFFCTNPDDCKKLTKSQLAKAIARGVDYIW